MQFDIGPSKEIFTVHENLVCLSPYFRKILQHRRKNIEGDCPICHEKLDPSTKELTFCSASCGNNFHLACIEDWHEHASSGPQCPLCRQSWTPAGPWAGVHKLPSVDADGFEIYSEWLYSFYIPVTFNADALRCAYALGEQIDDKRFCRAIPSAVIARFVHIKKTPPIRYIKDVYRETVPGSPLRNLIVGVIAELPDTDLQTFFESCEMYPPEFTRDLLQALAGKRKEPAGPWEAEKLKAKLMP